MPGSKQDLKENAVHRWSGLVVGRVKTQKEAEARLAHFSIVISLHALEENQVGSTVQLHSGLLMNSWVMAMEKFCLP